MSETIRILVLEDNPSDAELVTRALRRQGLDFISQGAEDKDTFINALNTFDPGIVLADYSLPGFSGMEATAIARQKFAAIPVIIVSGAIGEDVAIETMKAGATDYVLKQNLNRLGPAVLRAVEEARIMTERNNAVEALRESEEKFRMLAENARAVIGIVQGEHFIYVNPYMEELSGYTRDEVLQIPIGQMVHPESRAMVLDRAKRRQMGEPVETHYEFAMLTKSGDKRWIDFSVNSIHYQGRPAITGIGVDITDRKRAEEALAVNEQRFRLLVTVTSDIVYCMSPDWSEMRQLSSGTFLAETTDPIHNWLVKYIPADEHALVRTAIQKAIQTKSRFELEHRVYRADGTIGWVYSRAVPLLDTNGEIVEWFGFAADITDRKRAEETLAASELFYRQTLESIPGMVFTTRPDGYYDYQSSQWVRYTGVPMEQMLGDGWNKLLHPDDRTRAYAAWRNAVEERGRYDLEYRVRRYDGQYEWFKVRGTPIRDANGKIVRWLGVAANISDLKRAEDALRKSERRFRDLADSMPQIVWAARPDGTVDYYNRKWKEVTGVDFEKTGDQSWMPVLHPDERQRVREAWMDAVTSGKPYYTELRLLDIEKNEYRWYIARALPIRDEQGNVVRWFGTATDVHDLKQAQEKLAALKIDLENKNKEMESFIGIVSHDLRAPIVNIKGFSHEVRLDCQTLDKLLAPFHLEQKLEKQLDTILHKSIPESISYIETSSEAMSSLVKTLVEVARAGMSPLKPEKIEMDKLINQVIAGIKIKFKEADVRFDLSPLPDCYADRTQVTQIFTNLVDNAVKYLDPSRPGWVCIEGVPQVDGVLYWVSDNGIGISLDEQEKVFDPYYQLKEKPAGGVGMGLATVKRLVERNNGKVWVVSEKDQYSVFYVALPAHEPDRSLTLAGDKTSLKHNFRT